MTPALAAFTCMSLVAPGWHPPDHSLKNAFVERTRKKLDASVKVERGFSLGGAPTTPVCRSPRLGSDSPE